MERQGKCELSKCVFCKKPPSKRLFKVRPKTIIIKVAKVEKKPKEPEAKDSDVPSSSRYFRCDGNQPQTPNDDAEREEPQEVEADEEVETEPEPTGRVFKRPTLGTLPAFIPLGGGSEKE